jgi:hypothetical protein
LLSVEERPYSPVVKQAGSREFELSSNSFSAISGCVNLEMLSNGSVYSTVKWASTSTNLSGLNPHVGLWEMLVATDGNPLFMLG